MSEQKKRARRIAFCCNDHRNGMFIGRFDAVNFSLAGELVELEGPPTVIRILDKGRLQISRYLFRHRGYTEWVGNWCWDEFWIPEAARLLRVLRKRGFTCHCAPTRFFEAFNRKPQETK
jgi:hypothetical protein